MSPSLASVRWALLMTATSSIAHGGQTRGTTTLLRRETIVQPDGTPLQVPVISGNSLRGRLRRIAEELLRDQLRYEGQLSPAAAHAIRGGGTLVKTTSEPLSGSRLATVRALVPHVGVFGLAGGGAVIDGALAVGKVVPVLTETAHITGLPGTASAFTAVQLESYTRVDDTDRHDTTTLAPAPDTVANHQDTAVGPSASSEAPARSGDGATRQMLYQVETLPAGTMFTGWLQLRRPTELELSLLTDILATYSAHATLGGRLGSGHGTVQVTITPSLDSGTADPGLWREHAAGHRDQILAALETLT